MDETIVFVSWPFPSSVNSLFQNEAKCKTFFFCENEFFFAWGQENPFHISDLAFSLTLKQRLRATREWRIDLQTTSSTDKQTSFVFVGGVGWRSCYLHEKASRTTCPTCRLSSVSASQKTWWRHRLRLRVFWRFFYGCAVCTLICTFISKPCAAILFALVGVLSCKPLSLVFKTFFRNDICTEEWKGTTEICYISCCFKTWMFKSGLGYTEYSLTLLKQVWEPKAITYAVQEKTKALGSLIISWMFSIVTLKKNISSKCIEITFTFKISWSWDKYITVVSSLSLFMMSVVKASDWAVLHMSSFSLTLQNVLL